MTKQTGIEIEGFQKAVTPNVTGNENAGEFITPETGTIVEGRIVRAFLYRSGKKGQKDQVCYAIQNGDETPVIVSEKAAFKEAIRKLRLNDEIKLIFKTKVEIPNSTNEMWEVDFFFKSNKGPIKLMDVLMADYERLESASPF